MDLSTDTIISKFIFHKMIVQDKGAFRKDRFQVRAMAL